MRRGIRFRLGMLLAAFGVLATGLAGLSSYAESRAMLVRAAERELMSATQVFGRKLADAVRFVGDDARLLAELQITRGAPAASSAAASATPVAAPNAAAAAAPATTPTSAHDDVVAARTSLVDTFGAFMRSHPAYLQLRLVGDDGREVARVDRDTHGPVVVPAGELQEQPGFPDALPAMRLGAGELHLSRIGIRPDDGSHAAPDRPTLHVATPVVAGGRAAGAVVVSLDITRVFATLQADLPSHLQLLLANERGDYLVHPDANRAFAFEHGQRALIQETFGEVQRVLQGHASAVLARAALAPPDEAQVLGAFVRLPLAAAPTEARFLVIGIVQPFAQIIESTRLLGRRTLQMVLAVSAIAIVLAMAAARLVTRPLKQMTREVRRFSTEQTMGELPTGRQDEIGELARGFSEMRERVTSMLGELDASRNRLAHMARHDGLTGLPNRALFIDRLEHAIRAARRSDRALAVLFIDIDRFKQVNDSHGHAVGDEVLVQSATLMRAAVREADTVARWGGDEFVILLEDMDEEHEARRVAHVLLGRFAHPLRVGTLELELGASIGISMYPRDGFEAAELIQRADEAMYLSKHRAGNRYSVFGNQIDDDAGTQHARDARQEGESV